MQLRFSVREPQFWLYKMNISFIIRWSRIALQQETRATALSSSSHLLALPPSVSYSSCFRLSICLFFCALFCPKFERRRCQNMSKGVRRTSEREREIETERGRQSRRGANECRRGRQKTGTWGKEKWGVRFERCHWFCNIFPFCPLTPIPPLDIIISSAMHFILKSPLQQKCPHSRSYVVGYQSSNESRMSRKQRTFFVTCLTQKTTVSSYQTEQRCVVTLSERGR